MADRSHPDAGPSAELSPWLGVEVRHLATLVAIERTRSFRGAARELGYVQSAVSQQIAALERAVDMRLIDRGTAREGITLTSAGSRLVAHARRVLMRLDAARMDLGGCGGLTVGLGAGVATALLPRLVPALDERLPDTAVRFCEPADEDELDVLMGRGEIAVSIGEPPERDDVRVVPVDLLLPSRRVALWWSACRRATATFESFAVIVAEVSRQPAYDGELVSV